MYKERISPFLDRRDSETWHIKVREMLHRAENFPGGMKLIEQFAYKRKRFSHPKLSVTVAGIEFDSPLMVAAGWDKPGRAVKGLWQLGFSGVEVGTVLRILQYGNPKPRQFMVAPGVALNRLGFNCDGRLQVFSNLRRYKDSGIPIGISIGKEKDVSDEEAPQSYAYIVKDLYSFASYFAINVSSPNTPGLRGLQDKEPLTRIVYAVNNAMKEVGERKPLFVKIAPELSFEAIDDVIEVVLKNGASGIIASNTTVDANIKAKYGKQDEPGGLSGDDRDFRDMSTRQIAYIYNSVGDKLIIIGVGGIKNTTTAYKKIAAGATLLQLNTALRGEGPTVAGRITRGLVEIMDLQGVESIQELVGVDAAKYIA